MVLTCMMDEQSAEDNVISIFEVVCSKPAHDGCTLKFLFL